MKGKNLIPLRINSAWQSLRCARQSWDCFGAYAPRNDKINNILLNLLIYLLNKGKMLRGFCVFWSEYLTFGWIIKKCVYVCLVIDAIAIPADKAFTSAI